MPVAVVLGGAGTGKTTTAAAAAASHLRAADVARERLHRAMRDKGTLTVLPARGRVLMLSFSRTAVAQAIDRAAGVVGRLIERIDVVTFDGLAWRILNHWGDGYGYPSPLTAKVGLLTGDNAINGDAPVVVMTTEVLRNMIYAGSPALDGLRYVVLDEVHYLQDAYRGPVWEEVIIHLPPDGRPGVPVGHGVERRGARRLDRDGAGADRGGHRGATAGRAATTCTWSATATPRRLHLLPTLVDGRPNPEAARLDSRVRAPGTSGAAGPGPAAGCSPRGGSRWSSGSRDETCCPAIYFIFSRAACDDAVDAVPRRRACA